MNNRLNIRRALLTAGIIGTLGAAGAFAHADAGGAGGRRLGPGVDLDNDTHEVTLPIITTTPVRVPMVDIAILLDTSGSMSGLINQARAQLWKLVNEFQSAKQNGLQPNLRVALYEYGKSTLSKQSGFLRQITPLTSDLDLVSEELFALSTNGGDEYCGKVVQESVRGLQWSTGASDLRMVFIAGNEPFTQGPVDWREAIAEANRKDITVNTLHCGTDTDASRGKWNAAATLAGGSFLNIDHNMAVAHVVAPQDKEIERLGREINKTYVAYGSGGKKRKARQEKQDSNAVASGPGSMMQRAVSKSSRFYRNSDWDLVDASKDGAVALADMEDEALPDEMKGMGKAERLDFVAKKQGDRTRIQAEISRLNVDRKKFVASSHAAAAAAGEDSLDSAMIKAVHTQAEAAGYSF
jgi:hypothetical protein